MVFRFFSKELAAQEKDLNRSQGFQLNNHLFELELNSENVHASTGHGQSCRHCSSNGAWRKQHDHDRFGKLTAIDLNKPNQVTSHHLRILNMAKGFLLDVSTATQHINCSQNSAIINFLLGRPLGMSERKTNEWFKTASGCQRQ